MSPAANIQLLGFGWAHNHDTRLIFPGDPGGQAGKVLFKAHSANQYEFVDNGDGTYAPVPGLLASLSRDDGPPITYTIIDPRQATYTFDEFGKLLTWADPQGHSWTYTYDGSSRLDRVTRHRAALPRPDYDPQGRMTSPIRRDGM
jgi:YD repeat-containing protein